MGRIITVDLNLQRIHQEAGRRLCSAATTGGGQEAGSRGRSREIRGIAEMAVITLRPIRQGCHGTTTHNPAQETCIIAAETGRLGAACARLSLGLPTLQAASQAAPSCLLPFIQTELPAGTHIPP